MNKNWTNSVKSWIYMQEQKFRNTKCCQAFNEYSANQYRTTAELNALNWSKRHQLLVHAFRNIPYYRDRFTEAGLREKDFEDPAVWTQIPILTKRELVDCFEDIKAPGKTTNDYYVSATGGTTGQPVKVLHDASFPHAALRWRMLRWWGLRPGTDEGRIWRYIKSQALPTPSWKNRVRQILFGCLEPREVLLDSSCMDDASIEAFLHEWNAVRPPLLTAYIGSIHHVACHILKHRIQVHSPTAIWATSAPMSSVQRSIIQEAFRAPVYDQYGSGEVYWFAAECRCQQGLHMFVDARHFEFIKEDGTLCPPDQSGRILVTDLENMVFPIIRYENGDIGRQLSRPCSCGVNLPLMDPVKGRVTENIKLKDSTILSGEYLAAIFDDNPHAVRAFQLWQRSDYSVVLRVIPNPEHLQAIQIIEDVKEQLSTKMMHKIPVTIEYVQSIPADLGKTRYIISDVGVKRGG